MSLPAPLETIPSCQHPHLMNENPPCKCNRQRHHALPLHFHVAKACPPSHQLQTPHRLWFTKLQTG